MVLYIPKDESLFHDASEPGPNVFAGADHIGRDKLEYAEAGRPNFVTHGPRTAAEFRSLARLSGGKFQGPL